MTADRPPCPCCSLNRVVPDAIRCFRCQVNCDSGTVCIWSKCAVEDDLPGAEPCYRTPGHKGPHMGWDQTNRIRKWWDNG